MNVTWTETTDISDRSVFEWLNEYSKWFEDSKIRHHPTDCVMRHLFEYKFECLYLGWQHLWTNKTYYYYDSLESFNTCPTGVTPENDPGPFEIEME